LIRGLGSDVWLGFVITTFHVSADRAHQFSGACDGRPVDLFFGQRDAEAHVQVELRSSGREVHVEPGVGQQSTLSERRLVRSVVVR
jgi:hypothetical protein